MNPTKSIELIDGYTDKKNDVHKCVTFGKRPTVKDLWNLDANPQSSIPTQYNDLFQRLMITKFGNLTMPVMLNVLLSLNQFDREDLAEAGDEYLRESRGDRESAILSEDKVKLFFGFEIEGAVYDIVKFGKVLTGKDSAEADAFGSGIKRLCFEIGREIVRLESADGIGLALDSQIELENFESLDAEDFWILNAAAARWRQSFRTKRKTIQRKRDGASGVSDLPGDELERTGSAESPGSAN